MHLLLGFLSPLLLLSSTFAALSPVHQTLHDLARASSSGLVTLDSDLYDQVTAEPRDYSLTILLTAMGKDFKCQPCHTFAPEYEAVSRHWKRNKKGEEKDEHFFAVLDFKDGQATYQKLGLSSAPTLQLWRPTEGDRVGAKNGHDTYDFGRSGFKAEAFSTWTSNSASLSIDFYRPVDKLKVLGTVLALSAILFLGYYARNVVVDILSHTFIWAMLCVFIIITMNAGYMWNQIRTPPYSQPAGDGRINYITGGYSNQLGAETHIISAVYALLAFAAYTLAYLIPGLKDPVRQRFGVYVWTGISVIMMGVLMNIFAVKQGGYPFRLF